MKLYKVLINGESCHGGKMTWALPTMINDVWTAGEWQIEQDEKKSSGWSDPKKV